MLKLHDVHAYYGKSHVLRGVSMQVGGGEIVSLVGRNGVGRSTLCKAVMGLVDANGQVDFAGASIAGRPPHEIARRGIGYVPEDRGVFAGLTVAEHLRLGRKADGDRHAWDFEQVYRRFPRLKEREHTVAEVLSGGEQQMLAMARALIGNPRCLLVDEPTEGLAPKIVAEIAELLQRIAGEGIAILLVEQKLGIALDISDRLYVMGEGRMVFEGSPAQLKDAPRVRREWLEV